MKNFGARNGNYETSAVKNQRAEQREQRSLGDCWQWKANGSVLKEIIAVSATILISVEKRHSRIRLRILSCSRVSEKHREPEVPEEEVQVVEWLDGLARITSKELATTRSVKNDILQNACSTSRRMDANLGISALTQTARLMNSLPKGLKRMVTKVQWLC